MDYMRNDTIVKKVSFGKEASDKIFEGINTLNIAVASTLGASGKRVILENLSGQPIVTKDGVTVAESINLLDPVANIGCTLLKEASKKTVREAGDGTTTATVIAHSIIKNYRELENPDNRKVKEEIDNAMNIVIKHIEKVAVPITDDLITQVATISSNNDSELGDIIGKAFQAVGKDGYVLMESSDDADTTLELVEGTKVDRGWKDPHFMTDEARGLAVLENPLILIIDSPVNNMRKIQMVLEYCIEENRSMLIIGDLEAQPLRSIMLNKVKGNIKICVIDPPNFGVHRRDTMDDLAKVTGAVMINENLGDDIDLIKPEHLGKCKRVVVSEKSTVLTTYEKDEDVLAWLDKLKDEIPREKNDFRRKKLEERYAALIGKIAIIKVGAYTEVELGEKKDRVDDAIHATKAAIKEGILPGGGIALLEAAIELKGLKGDGYDLMRLALVSPYMTILNNAGLVNLDTPIELNQGYDVTTGKLVNMYEAGIVDPLLVTKSALINAVSVAVTIISTDCIISNVRADEVSK